MDKNYAMKAAASFSKALAEHGVRPLRIILFGSYAKGLQHDGSDIDLAVISDDFKGMDYWKRIDILSKAIYEVFEPIEAIAFTSEEWENSESGICAYARDGISVPMQAA